jgi:hypothetical protein
MPRPVLAVGDYGSDVGIVQRCLRVEPVDNDFGSVTDNAVRQFQRKENLEADGIVGRDTWEALEEDFALPPYPPAMLPPLEPETLEDIMRLVSSSPITKYSWKDRGVAPIGYVKGMAIAYATVVRKWLLHHGTAWEMAKANTGDDDLDALSWYNSDFKKLGMDNGESGLDTLRHLFVLLMGLGMRESSGQYCCGRDMSAENVSAETAEAGLFQMSWNASGCCTDMQKLFDEYIECDSADAQCALNYFSEGVVCDPSDWECYGDGAGYEYQQMAKDCPQFAVETAAIGLRNLRQHWGPINRKEAELRKEADIFFSNIQDLVMPATV